MLDAGDAGMEDRGERNLLKSREGKQRPTEWNLIRLSALLVSSLSHPAREQRVGLFLFFYGVYSNSRRVKLFLEPPSLIISSRPPT